MSCGSLPHDLSPWLMLFHVLYFYSLQMASERKHLVLKLTLWPFRLLSEVTLDLIGFPTLTQVVGRNLLPFTTEEPPEKGKEAEMRC